MKPKRSLFRTFSFPALIVLPAMLNFSPAGQITPDPGGNITVPAGTNAADTIVASGGTSPTPTVTVQSGATLTGDAVLQNGARINTPGYTLNNSGSLSGAQEGVIVNAAASGTVVLNNLLGGSIQGGNDGIYLDGNGGFITNFGSIRGVGGPQSDGIEGFTGIRVINSGSISGAAGIFAEDDLSFTNNVGGMITGSSEAGINALDSALIDNFGTISSTGIDGIVVNDNASIFNNAGSGIIQGNTNGIFSGAGLSLLNESGAVITGLNGIGVDAGDNAEIFNDPGAQISGSLGGVSTGALGYVQNDGAITGNAGDGVTLGAGGEIINAGTIQGTTGIVAFNGSTITSSGMIRSTAIGGNAFSGGAGADLLRLNQGSSVIGNVFGGGGANTLTLNGGLTSPASTGNIIRGSVSGFPSITKEGTGVALIGGVADIGSGLTINADLISITGGGLYFNADISGATGPQTTINASGAAVGGTGLWNADVNILAGGISAGAIPINLDANPENAVGAVAITGNVTHAANSFVRMDIVSGTPVSDGINSDIIEQIGAGNTYNLTGGNLRISSTNVNRIIQDGTYTVIDSDEVIIGTPGTIGIQSNANINADGPFFPTATGPNALDTVFTNYFLTTGTEDGGTNFVFTIDHDYANLPGLTANQSAIGGALDAAVSSSNPLTQKFIGALDFSNLAAVQATLASISPEAFINFSAGIVNSNYRLHRTLQDHLASTRSSGEMMKMSVGATMDSKGGMAPAENSMNPGKRFTAWGSVSYDWQDYDGDGPDADFDGETGALTAGFDYRVSSDLVLGFVLDGSQSDFDSDSSSADIDSLRALVYGTWGKSTGIYSDFLAGYGSHDLDLDRSMGGILGGTSSSSTDASSVQALWTVGYAFGDERIKHGPFVGLEYQNVEVDGYTQSGTVPVSVDDYDDESLRALVGYRLNTNMGRFTPYASVTYAHEFKDDGVNADAAIAGAPFSIRGAERGSAILITAGSGFAITDSLTLDAGYRGEISIDDEGIDSHGGSVGLKYRF